MQRGDHGQHSRPRDRWVVLAATFAVAWLAAQALATATGDRLGLSTASELAFPLPFFVAVALAAGAARRASGRQRRFWRALCASLAPVAVANALWTWYELGAGVELPYPSIADALALGALPASIAAIVAGFGDGTALRSWRGALDGSVLATALAYTGFTLLIEPQLEGGIDAATAVGIAYPATDILVLVLLGSLAFAQPRVPVAVALAGLAWAVTAITDAGYLYLEAHDAYSSAAWVNLGWQVQALLLCIAGTVALRFPAPDREPVRLARDPGLVPLLLGTLLTVVVTAVEGTGDGLRASSAAVLVYVGCAVVVRLTLTARESVRIARELERALAEQRLLALTDALTGLYNRRFMEATLRVELERAQRTGQSFGLLLLDLDRFKALNDRHGHAAGDAVLRAAAERLASCVRASDVVARYGGEEFVVLLPGADDAGIAELAERCRHAIGATPIAVGAGEHATVTVSVGGAAFPGDAGDAHALLRAADSALYAAKASGRDAVVLA